MYKKKSHIVQFMYVIIITFLLTSVSVFAHSHDAIGVPVDIYTTGTSNKIIIGWKAIEHVDTYEIEVNGKIINNGKHTVYVHHDLIPGQTYTYRIRAVKDNEAGRWTNPINQMTADNQYKTIDYWKDKKELMIARHDVGIVTINDKIYAVGGFGEDYSATIEEYNPITNEWRIVTMMPSTPYAPSIVAVNNSIYVIGGFDKQYGALKSVHIYNIEKDKWSKGRDKVTAASHFTSVVVNDKIYCIGGYNEDNGVMGIVEEYHVQHNTWAKKTDMPTPRSRCSGVAIDGSIYVMGGYNGRILGDIEVYDPSVDLWRKKGYMPIPRYGLSTINVHNKIYILGGYHRTAFDTVEEYDTYSNTFTLQQYMKNERFNFGAVVIKDLLYIIGGSNEAYPLASVEQASFIKPDPPKNFKITPEQERIRLEWTKEEDYYTYEVEVDGKVIPTDFENIYDHMNPKDNYQHTYRVRSKHYTTSRWTEIQDYILWNNDTPGLCIAVDNWYTFKEWVESDDDHKLTTIRIKGNNMRKFYTLFIRIEYDPTVLEIDEGSIDASVLDTASTYIRYNNDSHQGILNIIISQTGQVEGIDGQFDLASLKVGYKSIAPSKFLVTQVEVVDDNGVLTFIPKIENNDIGILDD